MGILARIRLFWVFVIFHLSVGIRLAVRRLIPFVTIALTLYYFFKPEFFNPLTAVLIYSGSLTSGLFSTFIGLSTASIAGPRISLGLDGWIRHLPASTSMHRRLAGLAIFIAQLPVLLFLFILALLYSHKVGVSPMPYLAGLPLLGFASAQCVLPVKRRKITRPLAAIACVSSTSWHWPLVFGAFVLLLITDFISGPLFPKRRRPRFGYTFKGSLIYLIITWRALRLRIIIPYLFSLIILGGTALFFLNNSFDPELATKVICFGGALSIAAFYSFISTLLVLRRPPWPWSRSLPWSARKRVALDSFFLAVLAIPLLVLIVLMSSKAVMPIIASLPSFSLYASHAIRRGPESRTGAFGKIICSGALGALIVSLMPVISVAFLALSPLFLKYAVKGERSQKVSRWLDLHHLAAGDSLLWSK